MNMPSAHFRCHWDAKINNVILHFSKPTRVPQTPDLNTGWVSLVWHARDQRCFRVVGLLLLLFRFGLGWVGFLPPDLGLCLHNEILWDWDPNLNMEFIFLIYLSLTCLKVILCCDCPSTSCCAYILTATCYLRSCIEFPTCGILLVRKHIQILCHFRFQIFSIISIQSVW